MSGIQAKICLPPSRPSLTSYALKTRGALRILGFLALDDLVSNDLMPQGVGVFLYSLEGPTWALGSNRFEGWRKCSLGRRWRNIPEADRWGPPLGAGWHQGGADRSNLAASRALPQGVASWSPLESSRIVFIAIKLSSFWRFDPSFRFSGYTLQKIHIYQNLWKLSV
jgi:hypothetical protein